MGEWMYKLTYSTLKVASRPILSLKERLGNTHWIRAGLPHSRFGVKNRKIFCPCRESNPNFLVFQPVANHSLRLLNTELEGKWKEVVVA
jgi:hypothetical protein